jgi:hypothetical protein
MKKIWLIGLLLVLFLIGMSNPASANPRLYFNPPLVESNPGENPVIDLLIDGCNNGISGYAIIVSLDNPSIASIDEVILPPWAELKKVQQINSTTVYIQGANTGKENKKPGHEPNDQLASITVHAISAGYATLKATPVIIDDEREGRYDPICNTASIIISGAGPVPKPRPNK